MFHRILIEEWQNALSSASMVIFVFVFLTTGIRVALLPRRKIEQLGNLPLTDEATTTASQGHE